VNYDTLLVKQFHSQQTGRFEEMNPSLDDSASQGSGKAPAFFEQIGNKVHYNKGEVIVNATDPVKDIFIVLNGKVKQYVMSDEGREKILFILEQGDMIGDISLFEQNVAGFFVEAIENTDLIHLTKAGLKEALQKYPEYNLFILSSLSKKAKNLVDQLEDTCFKDAETRVCDMLIKLAFYEGKMEPGSTRVTFRTSQQFISDMLGINRITAVKIIKNLRLMGLLDVKGSSYIINDLTLLQMYALKDC
jgi:CRP/FNR family transcriptional regulator